MGRVKSFLVHLFEEMAQWKDENPAQNTFTFWVPALQAAYGFSETEAHHLVMTFLTEWVDC